MVRTAIGICAAMLTAALAPAVAHSAPVTYRYAITSHQFGAIGTYVRSADSVDGLDRAQSKLRITLRVLGIPVFREQADESETSRGGELVSFESRSTVGAKTMVVHGELRDGRLQVTTPRGIRFAPPGTVAADPWSCRKLGPATVVTIKTGEILKIDITGGETERVLVNGVATATRHYQVSTAGRPNWWQIWLDSHDVPVKFRNLEHGRTIDFALVEAPAHAGGNPIAAAR
jgi:hypothetical protein